MDYTKRIRKSGNYISGEALQPVATATTVRVKNGKTLTTDGPVRGDPRAARRVLPGGGQGPRRGHQRSPPASPPCARARSRCGRSCRRRPRTRDPRSSTRLQRAPARRFRLPGGAMDLETLYREERPRALATLIRLLRDFDLAEEMLQEAFAVAARAMAGGRRSAEPVRLARLHRPPQGDRPPAPREELRRQADRDRVPRRKRGAAPRT